MTLSLSARTHIPVLTTLSGAAVLFIGVATAAPAWAHDSLIASTPESGEVLEESPEEIVLEFSGDGLTTGETVPNTIWVTDDDGEHWEGEIEVEGSTMQTDLPETLPAGEYEVLYHVVYSDGHSEEMDFTFEVTTEEPAEDAAAETAVPTSEETDEPDGEPTNAAEQTQENQTQEESYPAALWAGLGIGVLALGALGVVLLMVRRRLRDGGQSS